MGVHRVHYLKGKYGADLILNELKKMITESMLDKSKIKEFDKEIYQSASYEVNEKKLKRLLNYFIKYEYRDLLLDKLMSIFFDEQILYDELYLNKNQIIELKNCGNIIGSHSVSHRVLSRLSYADQMREIKDSFEFLENLLNQKYKSFCYPYGYKSSYNKDTLDILIKLGVNDACVFDNKIQSNNINKLELSRIDCNNFLTV